MPWEKEFDMDVAVDRAMDVFRAKGYAATSISDLQTGMGINKGSLYNAFKSKANLFAVALDKYDRDNRQQLLRDLDGFDDPVAAISALFDALIDQSMQDKQFAGCLLINTALDLPNQPDSVRAFVTDAMADFEAFFHRKIVAGQRLGTISPAIDPTQTAKSLLSLVVGLRVLSRGVFDRDGLTAIRDQALRLLHD